MTIRHAVEHAGWEVIWAKKDKSLVAIDFEDNLAEALELYEKVKKAGKPLATLRCKNVAFPPPDKYAEKMDAYNRMGVWWCPYCMKLRRFEKRSWAEMDGHVYEVDPEYACPICDITHANWAVCKYNPVPRKLRERRGVKRARASKKGSRRARRR